MIHPGPIAQERVVWVSSRFKQVTGTTGQAGQALTDVIVAFAQTHNIISGNGTLRGASLRQTRFTTGGPARDGKAANYTFIREYGASHLPDATFTLGTDSDGNPFVHCHAIIESDALPHRSAGHLFPDECIIAQPFAITLIGLPDITLTQLPDAETLHSVFEPKGSHNDDAQACFIRLRPNVDVVESVEQACRAANITHATILPSIGSLNAPDVLGDDGQTHQLQSVGMEVQSFEGVVVDGQATVSATLCNEDGAIFSGQLIRGRAPICVTAELVLVSSFLP